MSARWPRADTRVSAFEALLDSPVRCGASLHKAEENQLYPRSAAITVPVGKNTPWSGGVARGLGTPVGRGPAKGSPKAKTKHAVLRRVPQRLLVGHPGTPRRTPRDAGGGRRKAAKREGSGALYAPVLLVALYSPRCLEGAVLRTSPCLPSISSNMTKATSSAVVE
jgi:hypothetical protein